MASFDSLRRYTDASTGKTILEVDELDFLKNPKHRYGWIKRHFLNIWLKWALRHSDTIIAGDATTAFDIHRFYYIPSDRITVRASK
jgi:hypothetical protein